MGQKGDSTRKRICHSALRLFSEHGYRTVTMQDICRESGLSKGGLYRHYKDKAQLFGELLNDLQKEECILGEDGISRRKNAAELLNEYLERQKEEICGREPGLGIALYEFCIENRNGIGPVFLEQQFVRGEEYLRLLLEYGEHSGHFRLTSAQETAQAILFLIEGLKMCSEVMEVPEERITHVFHQIRELVGMTDI